MTSNGPTISVLMPVYNTAPDFLSAAIASVQIQSYSNWELCIVNDASTSAATLETLEEITACDSRIKILHRKVNGGIAVASNDALFLSTGKYAALLDHDDVLTVDALEEVAIATKSQPKVKIIYSDSDQILEDGGAGDPFVKPDFDYNLLLAQNYFNHLTVYERSALMAVGGFRTGFDGSQDYDLLLRVVEGCGTNDIAHIRKILYLWRVVPGSAARSNLGAAVRNARRAIKEHLQRIGASATVATPRNAIIYSRIRWQAPGNSERDTLVLVYGGDEPSQLHTCSQLRKFHPALHTEMTCRLQEGCLASQLNRLVKKHSHFANVVLLQSGFIPVSGEWLPDLIGQVSRETVGMVGGKLVSRHGELLSGPIVFSDTGEPDTSLYISKQEQSEGYFSSLAITHACPALSASFVCLRGGDLQEIGGFTEGLNHPLLLGSDLSLALRNLGRQIVWEPDILVRESTEVAIDLIPPPADEIQIFLKKWLPRMTSGKNPGRMLYPAGERSVNPGAPAESGKPQS